MKHALVNGKRHEPQKGLIGQCILCGRQTIAKCGEIKIHHWSHKGKLECDHWWENETKWHRAWKNEFPFDWQEKIHFSEEGEKHIADVKTDQGSVIEFQHSFISPEERHARNKFYKKIIWVVDGNRRQKYKAQFFKALNEMQPISENPIIKKVFLAFSQLLQEWADSPVPVLFDFGEEQPLWCLLPSSNEMWIYLVAVTRHEFIKLLCEAEPDNFNKHVKHLSEFVLRHKIRQSELHHRDAMKSFKFVPYYMRYKPMRRHRRL